MKRVCRTAAYLAASRGDGVPCPLLSRISPVSELYVVGFGYAVIGRESSNGGASRVTRVGDRWMEGAVVRC